MTVSGTKLEGQAGREVPKHFHFPAFGRMPLHKCFHSKETRMCFCGILPARSINTLIRKTQKRFNSLQTESLKTKRGSGHAQSSSGLQKGPVPANTAASVIKKAARRYKKMIHTYGIPYKNRCLQLHSKPVTYRPRSIGLAV